MKNEIINTLKEAESTIDGLKNSMQEHKEEIQEMVQKELQQYGEVLDRSLKDLDRDLDRQFQGELNAAYEQVSHVVSQYQQKMQHEYGSVKDLLVQKGVKEVMAAYGNFRNE